MSAQRDLDERLAQFDRARKRRDVAYLGRLLADPDLRGRAADELSQLGVKDAIGPISALVGAADPVARSAAVTALGRLEACEKLPMIIGVVRSDPVWFVADMGDRGDGRTWTF